MRVRLRLRLRLRLRVMVRARLGLSIRAADDAVVAVPARGQPQLVRVCGHSRHVREAFCRRVRVRVGVGVGVRVRDMSGKRSAVGRPRREGRQAGGRGHGARVAGRGVGVRPCWD